MLNFLIPQPMRIDEIIFLCHNILYVYDIYIKYQLITVTNEYLLLYFKYNTLFRQSPRLTRVYTASFEWYTVLSLRKNKICCSIKTYVYLMLRFNLYVWCSGRELTILTKVPGPWYMYHTDPCFDFTVDFTVNHFKSATKRAVLLSLYTARNII